jgi:hypothetical protein
MELDCRSDRGEERYIRELIFVVTRNIVKGPSTQLSPSDFLCCRMRVENVRNRQCIPLAF